MEQNNQSLVSWNIAIKVWWWIAWRSILTSFVGGLIIGFVIGFVFSLVGINNTVSQNIATLLGSIFGITANIFFVKKVIGKKFKNFTLTLIENK